MRALDDGAVGGLISGYVGHRPPTGLVAMIGRATDRNPFFVEERSTTCSRQARFILAPAAGPRQRRSGIRASPGVRQVLAQRLARLPALDRRSLPHAAAVLGRAFRVHPAQPDDRLGGHAGNRCAGEGTAGRCIHERGSSWVASSRSGTPCPRRPIRRPQPPRRQGLHRRAAAAIQGPGPLRRHDPATALHRRRQARWPTRPRWSSSRRRPAKRGHRLCLGRGRCPPRAASRRQRAGAALAERARVASGSGSSSTRLAPTWWRASAISSGRWPPISQQATGRLPTHSLPSRHAPDDLSGDPRRRRRAGALSGRGVAAGPPAGPVEARLPIHRHGHGRHLPGAHGATGGRLTAGSSALRGAG